MANWTQKKLLLTIGGSALAVCLAAGGGIYYTLGCIDEIEQQIAEKEKATQLADQRIAQIPALEQEVIILRENLDEYVKILPSSKELSRFVRMLEQFDRQSGVESEGLVQKPRREVKGEKFVPIEYSYEMSATLWQCLKFMNLVENFERFVSITDFSITAQTQRGEPEMREGDVVHKVKLSLQTFVYAGKTEGKEVQIPEYEDKRDALREEIWNRMQAIRLDRYAHRGPNGRRDVLVDPRERGDSRLKGPTPAEQRTVLDRYITEIARLRDIQTRIRKQDTTLFEQYSLEKSLKEGIEQLSTNLENDAAVITYTPYRMRWAKEVVQPFDELRGAVATAKADAAKDPYLSQAQLEQLVADMANDCSNGMLEQAKNRFEAAGNSIQIPASDPRHALAVEAKKWHVKASTAIEFKNLDLRVQGVVVNHAGKSGVLLNGEVYEEGDYVSDDLLVKMVEEEQVWFVFRGLTLVRTM
jgi:Tfp pilus assembly protein PilO